MQQDAKESLETDPTPENFSEIESQEPTQTEVDRSHYFEGLTGGHNGVQSNRK